MIMICHRYTVNLKRFDQILPSMMYEAAWPNNAKKQY